MEALRMLLDRGASLEAKDNVSNRMWMIVSMSLYGIWFVVYRHMISMTISVDEWWWYSVDAVVMILIIWQSIWL